MKYMCDDEEARLEKIKKDKIKKAGWITALSIIVIYLATVMTTIILDIGLRKVSIPFSEVAKARLEIEF